ncbi:mannose-1-phosphate guanyltransferase beta-like [Condylostylus longicornis]|uniref:mannose-1-phosphate guanyltransferase beta-like n=1 Tax=Condylostylus longicornis TaxID=2530218 RepID=UPI00244DECB8|nr:mannose-1-phosphate guanyltransferase beta-like [Condylostylus longicornis]
MKALILVGGYGTRLRPLTLSVPKPLIHFCNKSIVEHQISALVKAGVDHVILAVAYQPQAMMEALGELERKFRIRISCSREEEPLGTAGPIRLAKDLLTDDQDDSDDPFFVCNSDVICDFPLPEMLAFHRERRAEGTILITKVDDPSKFGVVVSDELGKIKEFVEKPKDFVGDQINAGLYILNKSVISRIALRPTSIEKEVFPSMAAEGVLFGFQLDGYWADIGQPKDFLRGTELFLASLSKGSSKDDDFKLAVGDGILGHVLIHPSSKIGNGCLIGPNVTIGSDCVIGDGVRISDSAIMDGVKVESNSYINGSIVGWQSSISRWVGLKLVKGANCCPLGSARRLDCRW